MTDVVKSYTEFVMPPNVVDKVDLAHLVREVEQLDNEYTTAEARAKADAETPSLSSPSPQLADFLHINDLSLENGGHARTELIEQLRMLKDHAPVVHMTFAVEADRESLGKLATWLRSSVHAQALISVSLQPALIAGVYLRTPNHVHDLSLRGMLKNGRSTLVKELETLRARG